MLVGNYPTDPDVGAYRTCSATGVGTNNPDATDRRVMADIAAGRGEYIDRQWDPTKGQSGFDNLGYPVLASGTPPKDSNNDGIPDAWEQANVPAGAGANTVSPTGYTFLENYLNELAGDV
jgi:hypothetical protein